MPGNKIFLSERKESFFILYFVDAVIISIWSSSYIGTHVYPIYIQCVCIIRWEEVYWSVRGILVSQRCIELAIAFIITFNTFHCVIIYNT